jgi:hypothetical protein
MAVIAIIHNRVFGADALFIRPKNIHGRPLLPSFQSMMGRRYRLQPYIRIFGEAFASIPDGIG